MRILWSGVFAVLMTMLVSGVWAALLLTNLAHAPVFPWASLIIALLLWALWSFLDRKWGPENSRAPRRESLRAVRLPFFGVIWPRDKERLPIWEGGADLWFWIHLGQAVLFAGLSLLALRRLARVSASWQT
jgi:hypothetical protein